MDINYLSIVIVVCILFVDDGNVENILSMFELSIGNFLMLVDFL